MKRLLLLFIASVLWSGITMAQNPGSNGLNTTSKQFYFGGGVGFGGFYPSDVNDYINDRYEDYVLDYGTYEMFMYFTINLRGSFFFTRYTELLLELEGASSPKFITVDDDIKYHSLNRIGPALKFNLHIPLGNRPSFYIGPGVSWNRLKFKTPETKYTQTTFGLSGQLGVMIRFRKFAIAPGITVNFIESEKDSGTRNEFFPIQDALEPDLSYTGGQISCNFYF